MAIPFFDVNLLSNLHIMGFHLIPLTPYYIVYTDILKWRTKASVSTLPVIPFSCRKYNIFMFLPVFLLKYAVACFFTRCISRLVRKISQHSIVHTIFDGYSHNNFINWGCQFLSN